MILACHFQTWKCCREFWTTAERALMDQHSTLNVLEMPSFTVNFIVLKQIETNLEVLSRHGEKQK